MLKYFCDYVFRSVQTWCRVISLHVHVLIPKQTAWGLLRQSKQVYQPKLSKALASHKQHLYSDIIKGHKHKLGALFFLFLFFFFAAAAECVLEYLSMCCVCMCVIMTDTIGHLNSTFYGQCDSDSSRLN